MDIYLNIKKKNVHILVVGDIILDKYIYCSVNRYSKEVDIPILDITTTAYHIGGAGNVCNNLKHLGFNCTIASVVGNDDNNIRILKLLEENKIDHIIEREDNRITTIKTRLYTHIKQIVRFDSETRTPIMSETEHKLYNSIEKCITKYNSIIISDYGKGCITETLCKKIVTLANAHNINCLIDSKTNDIGKLRNCTLYKPNRQEFEKLTNIKVKDVDDPIFNTQIKSLARQLESKYLLVTLDSSGFVLYNREMDKKYSVLSTTTLTNITQNEYIHNNTIDTCGAGDTVISILTLLLLLDDFDTNTVKYLYFLEKCADCIIHKLGTSTVGFADIINIQKNINRILPLDNLSFMSGMLRAEGKTTIFTNGCFDILHRGHVEFLKNCRPKADIFILGLNSDSSIRLNKGPTRPIIGIKDRIYNILALNIVDFIVVYDEKTPLGIIKSLKPNILAKGDKDYNIGDIIGREYADNTILVPTEEYYDTTKIINTVLLNHNFKDI